MLSLRPREAIALARERRGRGDKLLAWLRNRTRRLRLRLLGRPNMAPQRPQAEKTWSTANCVSSAPIIAHAVMESLPRDGSIACSVSSAPADRADHRAEACGSRAGVQEHIVKALGALSHKLSTEPLSSEPSRTAPSFRRLKSLPKVVAAISAGGQLAAHYLDLVSSCRHAAVERTGALLSERGPPEKISTVSYRVNNKHRTERLLASVL